MLPNQPASGLLCCGPSLFVLAAFVLSIIANGRCRFVSLNEDNSWRTSESIPKYNVNAIGLWCYQSVNGEYYDSRDINVDQKYDAARALGTATMAFGLAIWFFYLFAACIRCGPSLFMFVGGLCILNGIFQALTFLINKSEICQEGCSIDVHGKCAIAATVLWFVAGVVSIPAGKRLADEPDPDEPED